MSEELIAKPLAGLPVGCPLDLLLKYIGRAWTAHLLLLLADAGTLHFGALRRALPGAISARVLSARLREMEAHGLVARRAAGDRLGHVEYRLTEEGLALDQVLRLLQAALEQHPLPRLLTEAG